MRGVADALRSMVRHTDMVLNDGPAILGEVYYQAHGAGSPLYRWTTRGIAPGCLDVGNEQWMWLREWSPVASVEPVVGAARRWERRRLLYDPTPYLAEVGLPTSGTPVAEPGSLLPGPENLWEVRLFGGRGEVTFPFCRVNLTASMATIPQGLHYYRCVQPMSIECYPQADEDGLAASEEHALLEAMRIVDVLTRGFRAETGLGAARPLRVPLFDYEGVSLEEGVTEGRRVYADFLAIEDFAARTLPDPQDQRRCAAIADVRVSWAAPAEVKRGNWLTDSVTAGITGS